MRSVEFHTYLLPSVRGDGDFRPSPRKLTWWQAIAYPGALPIESSREVRQCPESDDERKLLGFHTEPERPAAPAAPSVRRVRRKKR